MLFSLKHIGKENYMMPFGSLLKASTLAENSDNYYNTIKK